jgi:nucleotide-binding universal stress UspA family protein
VSAFHTIICATDFSPTSVEAVEIALSMARDTGAKVHIVHVVPDPITQPWIVEGAGMDFGELRQAWSSDAEQALKNLVAQLKIEGRVIPSVLMGSPAVEILHYAADHGADLIVVGSHGHGAVRRFLLGSVADRVFKSSACPVMVVPHGSLRPAVGVAAAVEQSAMVAS